MDLYTCIYYFALFFAPIIGYLLLFKSKEQPLRKGLPGIIEILKKKNSTTLLIKTILFFRLVLFDKIFRCHQKTATFKKSEQR